MSVLQYNSACSSFSDHSAGLGYGDGLLEGGNEASTLCGRTRESLALLKAYQAVVRTTTSQQIIVHGESGSGKTALLNWLRDRLFTSHQKGNFVTGKYFQTSSVQEPHSAIMAAFSDLCDLVAQSDDFTEPRRQQIKEALGSDAQLLVKSISNLSPFVGNDLLGSKTVEIESSFAKFKVACKTFLRIMATKKHPVVIFLDDIQWVDEGSAELIKMLLQDIHLKNVLFIMAYRDEEAASAESVLAHARTPIDIQLLPLDKHAVYQLISSILGSSSENIRTLSELVSKRTGGNPFYIKIFMETIQREDLLTFDKGSYAFNLEQIQQEMMVSVTLAELLERKIDLLSTDMTETLKMASLIGYHFAERIIIDAATNAIGAKRSKAKISSKSTPLTKRSSTVEDRKVVVSFLSDAVREGFLELTSSGYTFTHDKIQASFQSLISESEEEELHLIIGEAFLEIAFEKEDRGRPLFDAVVHLNRSSEFLSDEGQRAERAQLNLEASKYCEEKSAFSRAVLMLQKGLAVLGPNSTELWSEDTFDLTFEMMESLARLQLIIGDFEGCKGTTTEALKYGKTVDMKINLLVIDVEVHLAKLEFEDSMLAANRALKTLGVDIPLKVKPWHAAAKLLKVRRMLIGKSDEYILNLPVRQDALATNSVKILMHVYFFCLAKQAKSQAIHAALLAMELTLRYGVTPHSSSAFVAYGAVEVALGKNDRACRYGHLALRVLDRVRCKEAECATVGFATVLLKFREETFAQLAVLLAEAGTSGLERGDVLYGTFCCSQSCQMHQLMGTNLATLEAYMREKYALVSDLSQDSMSMWLQYGLQSIINMRSNVSSWGKIAVLTGEIMDEADFLNENTVANHPVVTVGCWIAKAQTACYFDQYSYAAEIYQAVESMDLDAMRLSFAAPYYWWNAARTFYCLYEKSGKLRDLRKARKYRRLLQRIAAYGCPNARPLEAFLVTQELARAKHIDEDELHTVYERGIQQMVDANLVHLEGLLNEKAGFDYARRGRHADAERYFDRALDIYEYDWGAVAKYNWLEEQRATALMQIPGFLQLTSASPFGNIIEVTSWESFAISGGG